MTLRLPAHLSIRNGHLVTGKHDLVDLAERYGTPLYVINEDHIVSNFERFQSALASYYPGVQILYAAKANGNLAVLRALARKGAGADVFSSGELTLALRAGMKPERLLFNGTSKSTDDLRLAVESGVRVSIDSIDELNQLSKIASEAKKTVPIAFRVNPALEVPTHPKIATGLATTKFGIPAGEIIAAYAAARDAPYVIPVGMHCHIGSQILDVEPFARAAAVMADLAGEVTALGVTLEFIDLGGGLGVPYHRETDVAPTPEEYAAAVMPVFVEGMMKHGISPQLWVEPGRWLLAESTVLLTRVNSVKRAFKTFANVDAGFNLLLRPAMYDSWHEVIMANKADQPGEEKVTVAGPICETGDIIAEDRLLPEPVAGDLIAILDTGAYGYAMASQYNGRPRSPEVMVKGDHAELVRRGETIDDLCATMLIPSWQQE
ncbi:diaminopimelate decarboxylase [Methanocalculus chunghsingensis]|uniref:Diaminopimelate decarboxylase n=1 Tax=Methanocalculus chunghsingensis TaxID=156457 RepID=A0A8J7W5F0_9EURY|nr:diaminopimelate decarboxylase [Methanocalculus chunghsingensis]MBR1368611.1 diaminopimelate decarboxylase [Methanocalculus chunghsingensis]